MNKKEIKIDNAIIFSLVPILGTFYSYIYEKSYGDYFNIPVEFISIDLFFSLLNPVLFIVMASILYFSFKFCLVFIHIPNRIFRNCLCIGVSLIVFTSIVGFLWPLAVMAFIIFILYDFIIAVNNSNSNWREEKNEKVTVVDETVFWRDSLLCIKNNEKIPFYKAILLIIILIVMYICSTNLGEIIASQKNKFLTTTNSEQQTLVVLKVYNDKAICSPLNEKEHSIGSSFFIIDVKSDPEREFIVKEIGPFKRKR